MIGNQRVTVQPKEWKRGSDPRIPALGGRESRVPNWQTLASTLRWLRGTPLGSPEEPEVKRRIASSFPRLPFFNPSRRVSSEVGRILERRNHFLMLFPMVGRMRSMSRRSRLGGHGKVGTLRTKGSAVINLSRSPCLMADWTASWEAVKFRLTGILLAKRTAMLARRPPFPGGRMIPTRFLSVASRISLDRAMAAGRSFE